MAVINATSFLLLKDTTVIGHSKSTSFNVNVDLPESTSKDSLGFEQLADMVITKQKATFYFKDNVNPKLIVRGEGFISSVDETAAFETATSFNLEINLTGVFSITDPSVGLTWDNVFAKWEDIATNWEDV